MEEGRLQAYLRGDRLHRKEAYLPEEQKYRVPLPILQAHLVSEVCLPLPMEEDHLQAYL